MTPTEKQALLSRLNALDESECKDCSEHEVYGAFYDAVALANRLSAEVEQSRKLVIAIWNDLEMRAEFDAAVSKQKVLPISNFLVDAMWNFMEGREIGYLGNACTTPQKGEGDE